MSDIIEDRQERKEWIENSLTALERGFLADMLMRSLRGSWLKPRERAYMIEFLSESDSMAFYDPYTLNEKVCNYFENIGRGMPDGRFWRGKYQEKEDDVDYSMLDKTQIEKLARWIPNDQTWDEREIERKINDE